MEVIAEPVRMDGVEKSKSTDQGDGAANPNQTELLAKVVERLQQQESFLEQLRGELKEWMGHQEAVVENFMKVAEDVRASTKSGSCWNLLPPPDVAPPDVSERSGYSELEVTRENRQTSPGSKLCESEHSEARMHHTSSSGSSSLAGNGKRRRESEISQWQSDFKREFSNERRVSFNEKRVGFNNPRKRSTQSADTYGLSGSRRKAESIARKSVKVQNNAKVSPDPEDGDDYSSRNIKGTCFGKFVTSVWFDTMSMSLLCLNSLFIGVQIQVLFSEETPLYVEIVDYVFCIAFLSELCCRMYVHRIRFWCDPNERRWNWFDFFVVSAQTVDTAVTLVFRGNSDRLLGNPSLWRAVRIVRMTRVLRVVRVFRFFKDVRVLTAAIVSTVRTAFLANILLLMCLYLFSVAIAQMVAEQALLAKVEGDPLEDDDPLLVYFGSIFQAVLTLFMTITGGIDWIAAIKPLMIVSPIAVGFFIFFVATLTLCVLNVLTGIYCQRAIETAQNDKDIIVRAQVAGKNRYLETLTTLLDDWDDLGSGSVSFERFENYLLDERVQALLSSLEIEVRDAYVLFEMCDKEKVGFVNLEEFAINCISLRGGAKAVHLEKLETRTAKMCKKLDTLAKKLEQQQQAARRPSLLT